MQYRESIFSRFDENSEAIASKFIENLEEILISTAPMVMFTVSSNLQLHCIELSERKESVYDFFACTSCEYIKPVLLILFRTDSAMFLFYWIVDFQSPFTLESSALKTNFD